MDKEEVKKARQMQKRLAALAARLAFPSGYFEPIKVKREFSLDDLIGKTIQEHRQIKNPRNHALERIVPNPEYFEVLVFSDYTFMLSCSIGDGGGTHTHFYYFDGRKVCKSSALFYGS
jgi:hypothetical protein